MIVSGHALLLTLTIISGDGPDQAFVISMYDPIKPAQEQKEIHKRREIERPASYSSTTTLAKTGDLFSQPLFYALLAAGAAAIGYGVYRRRKAE